MSWGDGLAHWTDGTTAFISVAFSWRLHHARLLAEYYRTRGYRVRAGGAVLAIPENRATLDGLVEYGGIVDALPRHNPDATRSSRGCPVGCWFCIVPKSEGTTLTLLPEFTPRAILCDNNVSALPAAYQEHIIRRYEQTQTALLDVNGGFEPHTFDGETYQRWKQINRGAWRFGFDEIKEADAVAEMVHILKDEPSRKKRAYVLIGNEPIASCYERVRKVIEWGCEPFCQPLLPLDARDRHHYLIRDDWTADKLKDFTRYFNRFVWRTVPLKDYRYGGRYSFAEVTL